eukprot:gene18321-13167_t
MKKRIEKSLKLGLKQWQKWRGQSTIDVIVDQLVLGKPDQGIVIQLDDTNNSTLTCPISADTLIFAEAETTHQDEIFASAWTDFRSGRITAESPPSSTRILDCCYALLVQYVDESPPSSSSSSSSLGRVRPDRCAVLSCSDGYDHPIADEEQILIATAAYLCSQHLAVEFAKLFKERALRRHAADADADRADWNTLLSYRDIMDAVDTAQEQVRASLAALPSADMHLDVGVGNVSIVAFPSTTQRRRTDRPTTSTDVAAGDGSLPAAQDGSPRPSLSTEAPSASLLYEVIAFGVGDCAAVAFAPRTDGDYDCHVLYQPVEYPLFGGDTNVYGPTSFLDRDKRRDRAVNAHRLPEHSVVVLLTDGCWSHFSTGGGAVQKSRFLDAGQRSRYLEHPLDVEAMKDVVRGLPPYERRDARAIASALRAQALHRSEARRQRLATLVAALDAYRTSPDFDVTRWQYVEDASGGGRTRPYRWKHRASPSVAAQLPPELVEVCAALVALEGFSDDVPIVSLLDYRPVCGDDASVLVHVLPSAEESIVRAMLDVTRAAAAATATASAAGDATVLDVAMDVSVESGVLSGSVVPTVDVAPLLLDEARPRVTCHRPAAAAAAATEEAGHLLTRFYTRRGGDAASTTQRLRSKYDAAVVTELLEFMDHKVASLR